MEGMFVTLFFNEEYFPAEKQKRGEAGNGLEGFRKGLRQTPGTGRFFANRVIHCGSTGPPTSLAPAIKPEVRQNYWRLISNNRSRSEDRDL